MATLRKIPRITLSAFSVLSRSPRERATPSAPTVPLRIFMSAMAKAPPSNSNTMLTVVDVGMPRVLKMSSRMTSVTITARNTHITSLNEKYSGIMIPCRATSIMPLLIAAPAKTPIAAMVTMVRNFATLAPMAEFRKLTASLLTPTTRSKTARTMRKTTIIK